MFYLTKKGVMVLFLIAAIMLACCGRNDTRATTLDNFSKLIEAGDFKDIKLTAYYMSPYIFTLAPLSVDDLVYGTRAVNKPPRKKSDVNGCYQQKVVINGTQLEEYIDLLYQIACTDLTPKEQESYLDARIYYVVEIKNQKIFDVTGWSVDDAHIYVNGVEVERNDEYYDFLAPFLSEDSARTLQNWIDRGWKHKE